MEDKVVEYQPLVLSVYVAGVTFPFQCLPGIAHFACSTRSSL